MGSLSAQPGRGKGSPGTELGALICEDFSNYYTYITYYLIVSFFKIFRLARFSEIWNSRGVLNSWAS
jgi:hypothetical protein